jgi:hypothetical protein
MRRPFQGPALLVLSTLAFLAGCGDHTPAWAGKTFLLKVPAANWSMPRGIGGDIGAFVPDFLIRVDGGSGDDLKVTLATAPAPADVQDPCNPTSGLMVSAATYPNSQIVAPALPMRLVDTENSIIVNTTIHDFTLTDLLPPAMEGTLTATVDVSEVYPLFTLIPNATKESVCTQLEAFGAPCAICAFSNQPYCLTLQAVQLGATPVPTTVSPLAPSGIPASCNP